jgi:hypothetical protein
MPACKYVSNESVQSSSGVSSTGSVQYGDSLVGELELSELEGEWMQCLVLYNWWILLLYGWSTLSFSLFFLYCRTVVWNVGELYAFSDSIFVYTLLSKLMWHGRTECLLHQPCMWLRRYRSSFVFELVGVWRTSEKGDECGIKLELYSWRGFYLQVCAVCPMPCLILKGSNPVHFLGTTSMIRSVPGFGWIQH